MFMHIFPDMSMWIFLWMARLHKLSRAFPPSCPILWPGSLVYSIIFVNFRLQIIFFHKVIHIIHIVKILCNSG